MRIRGRGVLVFALAMAVFCACGGGDNSPQGELGAHCYPNGTCNVGLACVGGLCVAGTDAGIDAPTTPCGNSVVDTGEDCDQGTGNGDAVCDSTCHFTCGNGVVDTASGESCDSGIASGTGACPTTCNDSQACTADSLVSGGTCQAVCINTAITTPINGDGCCPGGANANTDDDCLPICGNSVKEQGETCDTGISTGTGACPATCTDTNACTTDTLTNGGTCQAACTFPAITMAINGDGCCPPGVYADTDNDCVPMCGNSVPEPGEQCDDGDADNFDGCDVACFAVDFSCIGNAAPTTATAQLTLSGTARVIVISGVTPQIQANAGATVTACKGNCVGPNALDVQTTATDGSFMTAMLPTGGAPLDAFLRLVKTGDRTTFFYPSSPFTMDAAGLAPYSFSDAAFAALQFAVGVTQSASNGTIGVSVVDCANVPIKNTANLVLSVKQGGIDVAGTTAFDLGTVDPQLAGAYMIFNVPPGATEVGATYYGVPLAAHTVTVVAGATTQTAVRPGGATGGLSLALSTGKSGGNCGAIGSGGAGIDSTTITLVHNSDSSCAPITFAISAGATQPAGTYTVNCTAPVVAPCIESDQTLTAVGVPSVGYTIHVRGRVGPTTCWSNDDSLQVPVSGVLSRTLNLVFASGTPGC